MAVVAGASLAFMYRPSVRARRFGPREIPNTRQIDEALEDSFPASDPPSFSAPATAEPGTSALR